MASKIEVWLIGAMKPIEIEGDLEKMKRSFSDVETNMIMGTTIDGETILILVKNIAYLKSVKEA